MKKSRLFLAAIPIGVLLATTLVPPPHTQTPYRTSSEYPEQERYLCIGFDDFRKSDFSLIEPLFEQYGATATYNRIAYEPQLNDEDISRLTLLESHGNEIGDHTWQHVNFYFTDALFNGQDPASLEGEQLIFPTNEQLRSDYGGGKNAFGFSLQESVDNQLDNWWDYTGHWSAFDSTWGALTDEQCQIIRNTFSLYKNTTGLLDLFDELSNRYLHTTGSSFGSWNDHLQMYEGGIFSGCKTSCNYEVWERILEITKLFYQDQYRSDFSMSTWSWPGTFPSPFKFEKDGVYYYDPECTIVYNYLAQFPSSLYQNPDGSPLLRSFTQVLRNAGYTSTHDTMYPSRKDGLPTPAMRKQFIYNASLSRQDALAYSTERSIHYDNVATDYNDYRYNPIKGVAAQMYDDGGIFYDFIESIRQDTSNGVIHGEVIDSVDSDSERLFFTQVLEYCKATGIKVISKREAYDICFQTVHENGNLIYNPAFRNTAKEFMPNARNVPENPDGYTGLCRVIVQDQDSILSVYGKTQYLHYGIPLGNISYSANLQGTGNISVYAIHNADALDAPDSALQLLSSFSVDQDNYSRVSFSFDVPNVPEKDYDQLCEFLGDKIMGIKIVYDGSLFVKDICLEKISN